SPPLERPDTVARRIDYCGDPQAPRPTSLVPSVNVVVTNDVGGTLLIRWSGNGNWAGSRRDLHPPGACHRVHQQLPRRPDRTVPGLSPLPWSSGKAGSGEAAHWVQFDAEDAGPDAGIVVHQTPGGVEVGAEDAITGDAGVVGDGKNHGEQPRFGEGHI